MVDEGKVGVDTEDLRWSQCSVSCVFKAGDKNFYEADKPVSVSFPAEFGGQQMLVRFQTLHSLSVWDAWAAIIADPRVVKRLQTRVTEVHLNFPGDP